MARRKRMTAAAVLAAGLVALPAVAQRGPGMHGGGFGPEGMMRHAAVALDLTDAQKQFAADLLARVRKEAEPVRAQMEANHDEMAAAVKANNPAAIARVAQRHGEFSGQLAALHGKAMAEFYTQLTPEQKAKADKMHETMRGFMRGRSRPPVAP